MNTQLSNNVIPAETQKKIDFLIRAVRNGKFDDVIKRIEFKDSLAGQHDEPLYIQNLITVINDLSYDTGAMQQKITKLENEKRELEDKITNLNNDMQTVAKAIKYLFDPKPLEKGYELTDISDFLRNKGIY